jgi:thymidylate kinase
MTRNLIVLEGADGSGKSTLAKKLAELLSAKIIHLGPLRGVQDIGLVYVDAMLPAMLGDSDVIMDRSWISEPIYGSVFRNGASRLSPAQMITLDRVAESCFGFVVLCDPGLSVCMSSFRARRADEMLEGEGQLAQVHALYNHKFSDGNLTRMPTIRYDYTRDSVDVTVDAVHSYCRCGSSTQSQRRGLV